MTTPHDPLLSGLAHALASPLFLVRGHAAMLSDRVAADREEHAHVEAIRRGADQMRTLLDGVILLAHASSPPALERVALDEVVRTAAVKTGAARAEVEPALPVVRADPRHVAMAVEALLDNAVRYGDEDVTIRVTGARDDDGRAGITVADDGSGFAPERLELALEPFRRLVASEAKDRRPGVGLALCVMICRANDGALRLDTVPGGGTTATLLLPAA